MLVWLVGLGVLTAGFRALDPRLDKAHIALAFILVVLGGSARHGRFLGFILSVAAFLSFNFFLIPPFHTFRVAEPLDWGVLGAFLITGGVAAEMLHRQQRAARVSEQRAREIDRLAGLGAKSLSVARAEEAVDAIARVIRQELPAAHAEILLRDDLGWTGSVPDRMSVRSWPESGERFREVLRDRRITGIGRTGEVVRAPAGGTLTSMAPRAPDLVEVVVPLSVRDRTLGVLRLSDPAGIPLEAAHLAFADALVHYAALAVERVRLAAEVAEVTALKEADRMKDAVLASLSHDLRTPLTSMRAAASELREEGDRRAAIIEEESERLNRLVTDLLDLSQLRAGRLSTTLEVNAVEDLVGAALQRVAGIPGAAEIQVDLPGGDPALGRFDFVHSLRALTNLLDNALRYSPEPGTVRIRVERTRTAVLIHVLDRGPGVRPEDRSRLFEPYFRSASTAGTQGTGLGLAIAASLAASQGGAVTYRERSGGGSVFELRLQALDTPTAG